MRRKYMKKFIAILLIIATLGFASCKKQEVESLPYYNYYAGINKNEVIGYLAEDGKSPYKVVVPDDYSKAEMYGATEFSLWFEKSTGAELPVVKESALENGEQYIISVGKTKLLNRAAFDVNYSALNSDGFIIKNKGTVIFINGANERGMLYGVYDFLEKYLGIRYLTSDETFVPEVKTCVLYATDIMEIPAFEYRNIFSYQINSYNVANNYVRQRMNAPECTFVTDQYGGKTDWYTGMNTVHNAFDWVSTTYYAEHPEMFSSKSGVTLSEAGQLPAQLCMTNGLTDDGEVDETLEISTFKVALQTFKRLIKETENSGEDFFFFGQNDYQTARCQCDRCLKSAEENGGYAGVNIRFLNRLMSEIRKWMAEEKIDRHIRMGTFAYQFTQNAPVTGSLKEGYKAVNDTVVPDKDLFIRIAVSENEYYSLFDERQDQSIRIKFSSWSALTENLMVWTYEMNAYEYVWYFPTVNKFAENIRKFEEYGVIYAMLQHNYNGYGSWQADMHTYVGAKLLWNPYRSTEELIDEYITLYYGSAADDVRKFIDEFDAHYEILANGDNDWYMGMLQCDELYSAEYYSIDFLENMRAIMDEAIAKVEKSDLSQEEKQNLVLKLRKVRLTPINMILKNYTTYYTEGRDDFAKYFFDECEACGVQRLCESWTMEYYKEQYGL